MAVGHYLQLVEDEGLAFTNATERFLLLEIAYHAEVMACPASRAAYNERRRGYRQRWVQNPEVRERLRELSRQSKARMKLKRKEQTP